MKIKNQILYLVAILSVTFLTFSCTEPSEDVVRLPTIVDIARADPNFSILVSALNKTGLATTFSSPGSYTVFAPTNEAFSRVAAYDTAKKIDDLNPAVPADLILINNLRSILQNHVLGVGTRSSDLLAGGYFRTFRATPIGTGTTTSTLSMFISKPAADVLINGGTTIGGATVVTADIDASNGVVHVINAVLAFPTIVQLAQANPNLSTLVSVVTSATQSTVLATLSGATNLLPVTVYAPTNAAFTAALAPANGTVPAGYLVGKTDANITSILNYHLERGTNRVAASATAFNATADQTVTTLFVPAPTTPPTVPTPTAFTFTITRASLRIVDRSTPAVNANVTVTNIQGTNGSIQIVDKVMRSLP